MSTKTPPSPPPSEKKETPTPLPKTGWSFLSLSLLVLILDQASKIVISLLFSLEEGLWVTSFFNLYLIHNYGAAFSFLSDAGGWQKNFFILLSSIISLFLFIWLIKSNVKKERLLCFSLSFILGGALGNLIDRIIYGYVIDFLDVHWGDYHWPVFNFADTAISIGVFLLLIDSFKTQRKPKEK